LRYFGLARQRQYLLSRKLSIIFMLRCDRIPVMLNLLTKDDVKYCELVMIAVDRVSTARRGRNLEYFTIAWNSLEGVVAIIAGLVAGSISLVGFGIDSFIEVTSGTALLWRMSVDADVDRRERNEQLALRMVGVCFVALAAYVTYESIGDLLRRQAPERSIPGIVLACVSLLVMPLLSRAKRKVAAALGSAAMHADAKQTDFCVYLSAILLGGLLLNALFGLWWADPMAALIMAPIIAKEGLESIRCKACHDCTQ
jgi:divalent metal cation (Fe/Co/Zn/Cd) transporter